MSYSCSNNEGWGSRDRGAGLGEKVQCTIREQRWDKKDEGAGMGQQSWGSNDRGTWISNKDE